MTQPATLTPDQIRQAFWHLLRAHVATDHGPDRAVSDYGRAYDVQSMTGTVGVAELAIALPEGETRHRLAHLMQTMLAAVDVPRPGGVLVVRGPFDAEDMAAIPGGIRCDVQPIGTVAVSVRLCLVAHAVTLDEARAHRRARLEAIL